MLGGMLNPVIFMQAPDASRSSMIAGDLQQPSTPTSARADLAASAAAFASPLGAHEAGVCPQRHLVVISYHGCLQGHGLQSKGS